MKPISQYLTVCLAFCFLSETANAGVIAVDDFSSGTNNGGTGWAGAWNQSMLFSVASPFPNNVSPGYLNDGYEYSRRQLGTPLLPSTTPEVWAAAYLRPTDMTGWQFGFEVTGTAVAGGGSGGVGGVMAGSLLGTNGTVRQLAKYNAEDPIGSGNPFTPNQPTLMVMRIYKNSSTDNAYNRADLYTDLDGSDGLYNSPVTVGTGLELTGENNMSMTDISAVRLLSDQTAFDLDYFAFGTTLESVLNPTGGAAVPEPATSAIAVLLMGGTAVRKWRNKRRQKASGANAV